MYPKWNRQLTMGSNFTCPNANLERKACGSRSINDVHTQYRTIYFLQRAQPLSCLCRRALICVRCLTIRLGPNIMQERKDCALFKSTNMKDTMRREYKHHTFNIGDISILMKNLFKTKSKMCCYIIERKNEVPIVIDLFSNKQLVQL